MKILSARMPVFRMSWRDAVGRADEKREGEGIVGDQSGKFLGWAILRFQKAGKITA
jgi:hypothetical protein